MSEKPTISLTADETMCILAAVVQNIANFMTEGEELDTKDRESLMQLRSAAMKIAQSVGMSMDDLHKFAAYAAGRPAEGVVRTILEEIEKEKKGTVT